MSGTWGCVAALLSLLAGCGAGTPASVTAEIRDASGTVVGSAGFTPRGDDIAVTVAVRGLAPGAHGIHVHESGRCEAPQFLSAGAHFNPSGAPHHGADGEHGHRGDLPNLVVNADGSGRLEAVLPGVTMNGRGHHSLFHVGGTSILIHRDADDLRTAPSGNSGERMACGVIAPPGQ